jgi:hypothetical protein
VIFARISFHCIDNTLSDVLENIRIKMKCCLDFVKFVHNGDHLPLRVYIGMTIFTYLIFNGRKTTISLKIYLKSELVKYRLG